MEIILVVVLNYSYYFRFNPDGTIDILDASLFSRDRVSKDLHFFMDLPPTVLLPMIMKFSDEDQGSSNGDDLPVAAAVTIAALSLTIIIIIAVGSAVVVAAVSVTTVVVVKKMKLRDMESDQLRNDAASSDPPLDGINEREGNETNDQGEVQSSRFSKFFRTAP